MLKYVVFVALASLAADPARAQVAGFDSLPEGTFATTLIDAGIRFTNLDRRLPGNTEPDQFVIEDADNMLWREPDFTPRNALGFGVYSPGLPVTFSRLGSFDIIPPRRSSRIALHVFVYGSFAGRTLDLTVSRQGNVVGSLSVPLVELEGLYHYALDYDGPSFDTAHLSIGPTPQSYIFALVDTVTIDDALPCAPDWDDSGDVDSADLFAFLADFFALDADFNDDGATDSQDFFDFLNGFFAGCY